MCIRDRHLDGIQILNVGGWNRPSKFTLTPLRLLKVNAANFFAISVNGMQKFYLDVHILLSMYVMTVYMWKNLYKCCPLYDDNFNVVTQSGCFQ